MPGQKNNAQSLGNPKNILSIRMILDNCGCLSAQASGHISLSPKCAILKIKCKQGLKVTNRILDMGLRNGQLHIR